MTPTFDTVPARRWMCGRVARALRAEHQTASARVGVDVHRGLTDIFGKSYYRKALLVDGQVAALWGVAGSPLSPMGFAWMAITDKLTAYPVTVARLARAELAEMAKPHVELQTTIIDGDEAAKRLMVFLGWHVTDHGEGAPAETRYGRKRLTDFIDKEQSLRIPYGGGAAIRLGFHQIGADQFARSG